MMKKDPRYKPHRSGLLFAARDDDPSIPISDRPYDPAIGASQLSHAKQRVRDLTDRLVALEEELHVKNVAAKRRADLKDYIQFIRNYVKDVQDAKRSGKTVDEVASSWKPPSGYTAQPARVRANAQLIFNETR